MAEIQSSKSEPSATPPSLKAAPAPAPQPRGPPLHQIYALPAPIRTFPLPTFYPNNPVSFFHVVCAWLNQWWAPPPSEPSVVHRAVWSPATCSVHVTNESSVRALWEQGFYGKGSLSRSEPNWLKREEVRRGLKEEHVSEILTVQRREERLRAKWERARLEQEAIRQTRLEEAEEAANGTSESSGVEPTKSPILEPVLGPPISPLALLALPNSMTDLERFAVVDVAAPGSTRVLGKVVIPSLISQLDLGPPVSPMALLALPNSTADLELFGGVDTTAPGLTENSHVAGIGILTDGIVDHGIDLSDGMSNGAAVGLDAETIPAAVAAVNGQADGFKDSPPTTSVADEFDETKTVKRRKSVRFSPMVESTTFQHGDPPSPNHTGTKAAAEPSLNGKTNGETNGETPEHANGSTPNGHVSPLVNKEHLQLMPEEAFFLSFGLGALAVEDPEDGRLLSPMEMFTLFRQYSYYPPRIEPDDFALQPDDKFLVHYAVYHHFRSLGWVPRSGIKFGVDWMLYTRGPVFDHAEFGLAVIPCFSDAAWKASGKQDADKTWQWLHASVRVLSHVMKSLVLVYVDVPSPAQFDEALKEGFTEVFRLYKVREVMVKRWSANRNR